MSNLLLYLILIGNFILAWSNTRIVKQFLMDSSLNGHICIDENVIFRVNVSKIACSVKCLKYSSCAGIFYDLANRQCTGCASSNGIFDVTQLQYRFYKLERKPHYIGCFIDCPRILDGVFTTSSSMTTEFCISHCLSVGSTYAMTEYSSQCFCGISDSFMDQDVQMPDTDCSYNCNGNSSQKCGGHCRGSLYQIDV